MDTQGGEGVEDYWLISLPFLVRRDGHGSEGNNNIVIVFLFMEPALGQNCGVRMSLCLFVCAFLPSS